MSIVIQDFSFFDTTEQLLEEMSNNIINHLLTRNETELISTFYHQHRIEASEISSTLDQFVLFYTTQSAKACLRYSRVQSDDEEIFMYVASNYEAIMDYAVMLIRESLVSRSLTENANGSIKSISSNGRSVTFMSNNEIGATGIPQTIKDRLPKPKARVW